MEAKEHHLGGYRVLDRIKCFLNKGEFCHNLEILEAFSVGLEVSFSGDCCIFEPQFFFFLLIGLKVLLFFFKFLCGLQGPVRMPVSANPGLNFNQGFFIFLSKALSGNILYSF